MEELRNIIRKAERQCDACDGTCAMEMPDVVDAQAEETCFNRGY